MGQTLGKMPETWKEALEEKNRILHWSSEIIARVHDNITDENTSLLDYYDAKIDAKVEVWIEANKTRIRETFNKFPNASEQLKNVVNVGIENITKHMKQKTKEDYKKAYNHIKRFNTKLNYLYLDQRNVHSKLQSLEEECVGENMQKFKMIFAPLRLQTFNHLRLSEQFIFEDKRLKFFFAKKVFDIDRHNSAECAKRIDKLLNNYAKNAAKELM